MTSMDRFVRWLTGEEGEEQADGETAPRAISRELDPSGLPRLENNAAAYNVSVEPVKVEPGTRYWRVTRVHHLSPGENNGRHHIYIDARKADGNRAFNSQAYITWEGGEHTATLDKPLNEPAANFPMFKWQVCTAEMRGMPSDRVVGLSSSHPDEPNPDGSASGNTLFHHSFLVIFQEVTAPQSVAPGAIQGREENSREGLTVTLAQGETVIATAPVAGGGVFTFSGVKPGMYSLRLESQSIPVQVQAGKTVEAVLSLAASDSIIEGTVHGGGGLNLRLVQVGEVKAEGALGQSGAFRLRNLAAGVYHLQVLRPGFNEPVVMSSALAMDGRNKRTVELRVPGTATPATPTPPPATTPATPAGNGSPLDRYVLFGAPDAAETQAQLAAALPRLAEKGLGFGFNYLEAAQAKEVIVIGGASSIPQFQMVYLGSHGVKISQLTGTPAGIAAQL